MQKPHGWDKNDALALLAKPIRDLLHVFCSINNVDDNFLSDMPNWILYLNHQGLSMWDCQNSRGCDGGDTNSIIE